jgi:putative oxidoreductase
MLDFVLGVSSRVPFPRWAPIPLRLIVGYGFMEHGYAPSPHQFRSCIFN